MVRAIIMRRYVSRVIMPNVDSIVQLVIQAPLYKYSVQILCTVLEALTSKRYDVPCGYPSP